MPKLSRLSGHRYNRESVERALTLHFGGTWATNGKGGYTISAGIGIVELKTLREAALFVVAAAEKERRIRQIPALP